MTFARTKRRAAMPRYSARARKMRGGRKSGPPFVQLPHYIKHSAAYHGLSVYARALLIELIYRHNGGNNGLICLGVREVMYELGSGSATVCRAMQEVDDAGLARPTKVGAWRGKQATEWRLMWIRCEKTGDLPVKQWQRREPYSEFRSRSTKGPLQKHREGLRSAREAQKRNSSMNGSRPRSAGEAHVDMYQEQGESDDRRKRPE